MPATGLAAIPRPNSREFTAMTRNDQAEANIARYQREVRMVQLQNLAANALTHEEAQRHIAEFALLQATINY